MHRHLSFKLPPSDVRPDTNVSFFKGLEIFRKRDCRQKQKIPQITQLSLGFLMVQVC